MNGSGAKDKAAIVTGSTKGIGRAVAEGLLDAGAKVAISARNAQEVAAAAKELESAHPGRVLARPCDVRREDQVAALFAETERVFGGVDILVNNAGVGLFRNLEEMSLEEWNSVIETNLTGVFLCSRAAIPRMKKRGGGYIFNISSLAGIQVRAERDERSADAGSPIRRNQGELPHARQRGYPVHRNHAGSRGRMEDPASRHRPHRSRPPESGTADAPERGRDPPVEAAQEVVNPSGRWSD